MPTIRGISPASSARRQRRHGPDRRRDAGVAYRFSEVDGSPCRERRHQQLYRHERHHDDVLVVDVAGLNRVSRQIYKNAAAAIAGMARVKAASADGRPAVGMTMFGVTTPCVTRVRKYLEDAGYDCLVFHATGVGGRAMEDLVSSDFLGAVVDITTTESGGRVVGGVFPAGPARFDAILAKRLPYIMSLGASIW